jgi:hypothetical protein
MIMREQFLIHAAYNTKDGFHKIACTSRLSTVLWNAERYNYEEQIARI